jgi:hypothetical protein
MIIYLLVKSFVRYFAGEDNNENTDRNNSAGKAKSRGISKEIGEYVDYEEIDKKKK